MAIRWLVAVSLLISFDQLSKWLAQTQEWVVLNPGVALGLGHDISSETLTVFLLSGLLLVICWWIWSTYPTLRWPLALLVAGATSNLIDRVVMGAVRDWLPIPGTSLTNNLADWFISLGIILCVWKFFLKTKT